MADSYAISRRGIKAQVFKPPNPRSRSPLAWLRRRHRSRGIALIWFGLIATGAGRVVAEVGQVTEGFGSTRAAQGVVKAPGRYDGKIQPLPENAVDPIGYEVDPETLETLKSTLRPSVTPANMKEDPGDQYETVVSPKVLNTGASFQGLGFDNAIPPDNALAVGPSNIIEAVNFQWQILNKNGTPASNLINNCGPGGWWTPVLPAGSFNCTDPRAIYDQYSDRWILLTIAIDMTNQKAYYLISTSFSSNPIGNWCLEALDSTVDGSTQTSYWADFPGLGVDSQAIYITSNQLPFVSGQGYSKLRILAKDQFYNNTCGVISWRDFFGMVNPDGRRAFAMQPAHTYGNPGIEYLLAADSIQSSDIAVWSLTNPLSSAPTLQAVSTSVQSYNVGPNAQQCTNAALLNTLDARLTATTYTNGQIWTSHTVACPTDSSKSCLQVLRVNPAGSAAVTFDAFVGSSAAGWNYFYPATAADPSGNMYMVFGRSRSNPDSTAGCAEVRATGMLTSESQIENSFQLQNGASGYQRFDQFNRNRWGDYSSIALDPADTSSVWVSSEYVSSQDTWGTWIARTQFSQSPVCLSLTTSHSGSGNDPSTSPQSSAGCATGQYVAGEQIQLTASPASGWQVGNWSGTNNDSSTSISNSLTMPSTAHAVAVTYTAAPPPCFLLGTSHTGSGGDPTPSPSNSAGCPASQYQAGAQIQLTASPASGWQIAGWVGTNNDNSTATVNSLTMPSASHTVTVSYSTAPPLCFVLSASHSGSGSDPSPSPSNSSGCPTGQYVSGEQIQLSASPASGWHVTGWNGTSNDSSTSAVNSLIMPSSSHSVSVQYQNTSQATAGLVPIVPCRMMDTRLTVGYPFPYGSGPFTSLSKRTLNVTGFIAPGNPCNSVVPSGGMVVALAVNLTIVSPSAIGDLRMVPGSDPGGDLPTSLVNFSGGIFAVANAATIPVSNDLITLEEVGATSDVLLDVFGYFVLNASSTP